MKYRVSRNLRDVKYIGEKKITADSGTVDEIVEQVNDMFNEYDDTFDDVKKKISTLESNDNTLVTKITQTEQSFANQLKNIWPTYRINKDDYEIDSNGNAWWIRKFTESDCHMDLFTESNYYNIYISLNDDINLQFPSMLIYKYEEASSGNYSKSISVNYDDANGFITYGNGLIIYNYDQHSDNIISPLNITFKIDKSTGELQDSSNDYLKTRFSLITFDTDTFTENSKITSLVIKQKIKLPE
jgi:hypothetical protein